MSKLETVYLYAGEEQPRVKLTCIKEGLALCQVIKFVHSIQELHGIELQTSETITENLKINCAPAYLKPNCIPHFYILEYEEINDTFFIWKSDGRWQLSKMSSLLYPDNETKLVKNTSWREVFQNDERFKNYEKRAWLQNCLERMSEDLSKLNVEQFWSQFDKIHHNITKQNKNDARLDMDVFNNFKNVVSIAIIKTKVLSNKRLLTSTLRNYHDSLKQKYNVRDHNLKEASLESSSNNDPPTSLESESRNFSPINSLSPSSLSAEDDATSTDYIYRDLVSKPSMNFMHSSATNDLIKSNFESYFKLMAEDYETFDLKAWSRQRPRKFQLVEKKKLTKSSSNNHHRPHNNGKISL
ncbi:YKR011C [Saccharomyces arboricola H-6]|uniref:YKR011C n=1 Tax=Saccharomyces arboricola (strain H-6 / AS 2.3317 / CBS 10644) TaxID=1160507 RepID=J8Q5P3_SACAR|nr:YKR011C [Saccharomyces arboricola H-6]